MIDSILSIMILSRTSKYFSNNSTFGEANKFNINPEMRFSKFIIGIREIISSNFIICIEIVD